MLRKVIGLLGLLVATSLYFGCSAIKVHPGAEEVIVSNNKPPKGCKYLGAVVGGQGNFFTGSYTSNSRLAEGANNDLRNKAAALGANYVQIEFANAGNTGSGGGRFGVGRSSQTDVTKSGNAYHCEPRLIGLD